ncbi:helix-turn-helix domain-containing protein [Streptomyces sp. NPDC058287]|uniref:helix-turn-helix domain-containing protein n=1 Tax=Streptomyces sp. NPDC058287 TaxID=3346423 RepID=UPI0036ED28B8
MEETGVTPTGRSRALAPLSNGLDPARRAFAEHLRSLRAQSGLTSKALAEELRVDYTRLSKFLNGAELPPADMKLTARLHRLLDERGATPFDEEAVRESRDLLYAAAQAKGPLPFRPYALDEAEETNARQQAEAAQQLAALTAALDSERERRREAEEQLDRLQHEQGTAHDEQIRQLTEERNAALCRVTELEDQLTQTAALLRLLQDEAWHLKEMVAATQQELAQWESGTLAPPRPRTRLGMSPEEVIVELETLRDEDRGHQADTMLSEIVQTYEPGDIAELVRTLNGRNRDNDLAKLLRLAATTCDGPRLRRLLVAEVEKKPLAEGFSIALALFSMREVLMPVIGQHAPIQVLIRLASALRDRSEYDLLERLSFAAARRPDEELPRLRDAGIPAVRWFIEPLAWSRKRIHLAHCQQVAWGAGKWPSTRDEAKEQSGKFGSRWCTECDGARTMNRDFWRLSLQPLEDRGVGAQAEGTL